MSSSPTTSKQARRSADPPASAPVVADEVDRKIIAELQVNGRASWTEIAERVGLSVPAVARRGQHLLGSGAVRVGIMPS